MEWRLSLLVLVAVLYTPAHVTGVTMIIPDTTLAEGQTLQITCQQENLGTDIVYSLSLERLGTSGTYQTVVRYNSRGSTFEQVWGSGNTGWQSRANATESFNTDQTGGSFVFMLGSLLCNDASTFRCIATSSREPPLDPTPSQNVTISGVTQNLRLDGPPMCTTNIDQDCEYCKNFVDEFGETPGYAEMQKPITLTCGAQFAAPLSMNTVTWYKLVVNQQDEARIYDNVTDLPQQSNPPSGQCTIQATSTLIYYPQPTDRELRIICQADNSQNGQTDSRDISICVQGLIATGTTSGPGDPNPSSAGLGGGPIAGIVIGVIAVIVLVVVLVYFLWYRRRDGGESYNTREADNRTQSAPPVSKKPEMHENSMYDTSGDPHRNNHTPQSRPEREPLHYAELDLVRGPNPIDNSNTPPIERVRRTGQATPYAEIQLPV